MHDLQTVNGEHIEVVDELIKYLGSLKSTDGNYNNAIITRIRMAKKRMLDLIYRSGETEE